GDIGGRDELPCGTHGPVLHAVLKVVEEDRASGHARAGAGPRVVKAAGGLRQPGRGGRQAGRVAVGPGDAGKAGAGPAPAGEGGGREARAAIAAPDGNRYSSLSQIAADFGTPMPLTVWPLKVPPAASR